MKSEKHETEPYTIDSHAGGDYPEGLYDHRAIADKVNGLDGISGDGFSLFRQQGYLAVEAAFTEKEVEDGLAGLSDLIMGKRPDFRGISFEAKAKDRVEDLTPQERLDWVRKLVYFVDYDTRLKALAFHRKLMPVVRRLLGAEPELFADQALIKPPKIGREKPWHQDHAFFDLFGDTPVVGVWIALDAATLENGCMRLLSGAHRQGPRIHFTRRDWQICDDEILGQRSVAAPLDPGGLLLFDGLLPHGTPANASAERRRALQFHYIPKGTEDISREERLKTFGSDGKDVTC